MKTGEYFFVIAIFLFGVVFVSAQLGSTNYNITTEVISDGGAGTVSSNYNSTAVIGIVSGKVSSDNYINQLGVFYGLNSPPTIVAVSPEDGNVTTNRTPTFIYDGTDSDGDILVYDINISKEGTSICTDHNLDVDDYAGESYTPSVDLKCLSDNGDYYSWTVRVCENDTAEGYCSEWTDSRTINISSLIAIDLPNAFVDFGSMDISEINDTTDDSPAPLLLENTGNARVNISMNASQLWDSIAYAASNNSMSKVRSYSGNASWANTSWFQLPTITGSVIAVSDLNYSSGSNGLAFDVLLEVPGSEPPGDKTFNINFIGSLSEVYPDA